MSKYIKKIIFKGLSTTLAYTAIGGIRFYDGIDKVVQSGTVISNSIASAETSLFTLVATSTYNVNYNVLYAFDTSISQTAPLYPNGYWLSTGRNQDITVNFKSILKGLKKIEFNITPDASYSDRNISQPFTVEIYDESNTLSKSYTVNPSSTIRNTIMVLNTPEFDIKNKSLLQSSSGEVESFDMQTNGKMLDSIYKGTGVTLSNNNRSTSITGNVYTAVGDKVISKGKHYWEVKTNSDTYHFIGVIKDGENLNILSYNTGKSRVFYALNGTIWNTTPLTYGTSLPVGSILSVLLDLDNGTIEFWKNGVSMGVAFTDLTSLGSVRPSITKASTSSTGATTFSFIEKDFTYKVPEGYTAYGTDELLQIKSLDSLSESTFIEKGLNDISVINPKLPCTKKQYIKSQSTTLGTGKTFEQPLELDRYTVNKITFQ